MDVSLLLSPSAGPDAPRSSGPSGTSKGLVDLRRDVLGWAAAQAGAEAGEEGAAEGTRARAWAEVTSGKRDGVVAHDTSQQEPQQRRHQARDHAAPSQVEGPSRLEHASRAVFGRHLWKRRLQSHGMETKSFSRDRSLGITTLSYLIVPWREQRIPLTQLNPRMSSINSPFRALDYRCSSQRRE